MAMDRGFTYEGSELDLFSRAVNWRKYWSELISPYLGTNVLEVGAGLGSVTRLLHQPGMNWTAAEPDPELAQQITSHTDGLKVHVGTLDDLGTAQTFDSVIYIDVLEHIQNDAAEVRNAYAVLNPGGRLIILAPAHQWLYTSFDKSIGHFRRYSLRSLRALKPSDGIEERAIYLDSVGTLASLGNRLVLNASTPTPSQIALWDRRLVPISRVFDKLTNFRFGKSVIVVWRKP
jgi:SAM-dependent methyltransferase